VPRGERWKWLVVALPLTPRAIFVFVVCYILDGLATSFSVTSSEYLGHNSVSRSWVQGHGSENAVACNSKTTGRKLLGLDWNICYDNARSNSELLTLTFDPEK